MSLAEIIMWSVALLVGVPAAWRNPTAGALVLCWVFSEALYVFTGNGLATEFYIFPDLLVVAVIFAKPAAYCIKHRETAWERIKCLFTELSVPDRIVLALFPVAWWVYVSDLAPYYQYWGLWALSIAQFLAAGWEGFARLLFGPKAGMPARPDDVMRLLAAGYG